VDRTSTSNRYLSSVSEKVKVGNFHPKDESSENKTAPAVYLRLENRVEFDEDEVVDLEA
jgi:hypothetical protein